MLAQPPVRLQSVYNSGSKLQSLELSSADLVARAIAVGNAANDAVEQALSKTSLSVLVRGVG